MTDDFVRGYAAGRAAPYPSSPDLYETASYKHSYWVAQKEKWAIREVRPLSADAIRRSANNAASWDGKEIPFPEVG